MFQLFTLIKYIERACNALQIILINAKSSSATSPCMGHTLSHNVTWTPNHGKLLESASAWKKVAHPLAGTPIASTFFDSKVGLRQLSVRQTFTTFQRSALSTSCVTLSRDNKRILSGHQDRIISGWAAPDNVLPETPVSMVCSCLISRPFIISSHISLLPRLKFRVQRHVSILNSDNIIRAYLLLQILEIDTKTVTIQPSSILNSVSGIIFANRSKVKLEQSLWEDAQKVR
jgi:hypothetical protein